MPSPHRFLRALLGAALLMGGAAGHAADLSLMPVSVELGPQRDRATVEVFNQGPAPVTLQADAVDWRREAGEDRHDPTDALIVNPPLFTVQPGQRQVVRVGLRRAAAAERETTYRMVLREIAPPAGDAQEAVSGHVRVLMALRVPVYVAPRQVARDERWEVLHDAQGRLVAEVTNAGNVHLKVGALRLHDGSALPVAEEAAVAVLFPGETHRFALRPRAAVAAAALTLEVLTDRGLQHVPVALAAR